MPSDRLEGVALVTGGGRGIGASIAHELANAGMRVAISARSEDQVAAVAGEIGGLALVGDVSTADDVKRWVDTTERELGPIELLVCNAGISGSGVPFLDESPDEWWRVFEVNVLGAYLCCRAVAPRMVERGRGRIVNMGSGGSYLPITNPTVALGTSYGASKAALGRFSETLAAALGPTGVRCPVAEHSRAAARADESRRGGVLEDRLRHRLPVDPGHAMARSFQL